MAKAIQYIVNNKKERDRYRKNGLIRAKEKFNFHRQVEALNTIYSRLLS